MVKEIRKFIAYDGKEFLSVEEAEKHENKLRAKEDKNFEKFLNTYNFKQLRRDHSMSDYGVWKVVGEDPNCDFGGHHHNPFLGYFEGTLEAVIRHAVNLPNFWQWGSGGKISFEKPPKVTKV